MPTETNAPMSPNGKKTKKISQERLMVMFTLFFILGIVLLVIIPEESPVRPFAMGIYSVLVFWAMFRFCI